MAKTDYKSVDEYLKARPAATQRILDRVRRAIRKSLPEAAETISYQIPCYKLNGKPVIYFASWKGHYSLYPVNAALVAAFERELGDHQLSKGTIRFPLARPVPVKWIGRIAKLRAQEIAALQKSQA